MLCENHNKTFSITIMNLNWILIAAIIATVFWKSVRAEAFLWLICFGSLLFFIGLSGALTLGHKCKQCGYTHRSMENILNYQEFDRSVLDIPYEATVKYYKDDY